MGCVDYTGDIYIEITNDCNLRCYHCYNDSSPLKGHKYISLDNFHHFLNKAIQCKTKTISLSGGEPLLNPDLIDIVNLICNNSISCRIITNGVLINKSFLSNIPSSVHIQVSLNGSTYDVHEKLTGVSGSFNSTISAIELLKKMGTPFSIKTIVSPYNSHDYPNLVDLAKRYEAKGISFSFLQPFGRALNNQTSLLMSNADLINIYVNDLCPLFDKYPGFVSGPKIQNSRCPLLCAHENGEQPFVVSPRIDVYGNVYPCAMFITPVFAVGNIFNQTFEEIFTSIDFCDLIRYMQLREKYVNECKDCMISKICGRGCPASSLEKDTITPNYYCKMVKWKLMSDAVKGEKVQSKNES